MKVRALRTGFFGGRRRPGTVFDVPEGSQGSWFVPVDVPEEQAPTIDAGRGHRSRADRRTERGLTWPN